MPNYIAILMPTTFYEYSPKLNKLSGSNNASHDRYEGPPKGGFLIKKGEL